MNKNQIVNFLSKNKTSPIIFLEAPYSDVNSILYGYIKSINCLNKSSGFFCGDCLQCKKIDNKSYFDLIELNGFQKNIIKEDVVQSIEKFKASALESTGNKFLIIKGIENANKSVCNSLLASIENPKTSTYYLFVSRNLEKIIPTIKSRCQILSLGSDKDQLIDRLMTLGINGTKIDKLLKMYNYYEDILISIENGEFEKIDSLYTRIIENNNDFANLKFILDDFKKLNHFEIELLINYFFNQSQSIKKIKLSELINDCRLKLNKTLIYNSLINIVHDRGNNE